MRSVLYAAVLGVFGLATAAWGETEYPILEAQLTELNFRGPVPRPSSEKRLIANGKRDVKGIVSFTFQEAFHPCPPGALCPDFLRSRHFAVVRTYQDHCGSTRYLAVDSEKGRLSVVDHEGRLCDDYQPHRWVVTLQDPKARPRYFVGDPEEVPVADNCLEQLVHRICPMIFLPVTCTVKTVDGGRTPLEPVIKVQGGNPCSAQITIDHELCLRGIDPARVASGDVDCVADPRPDGTPTVSIR